MPVLDLPITKAQARRLQKGLTIRLNKTAVSGSANRVPVNVPASMARKLSGRLKRGRGFQLSAPIRGGGPEPSVGTKRGREFGPFSYGFEFDATPPAAKRFSLQLPEDTLDYESDTSPYEEVVKISKPPRAQRGNTAVMTATDYLQMGWSPKEVADMVKRGDVMHGPSQDANKNMRKRARFAPEVIDLTGDGIGQAFKRFGKATQRGLNTAVREVKKRAPGVVKQVAHETGRAAQQAKKYVPRAAIKGAVKGLAMAATTAIGQPELAPLIQRAVNPGIDAAYDTNLARGSVGKNFAKSYAKHAVSDGMDSLFTMG